MADELDINTIQLFQPSTATNKNNVSSDFFRTTPYSTQVPAEPWAGPPQPIIDPFTQYISTIVLYVVLCMAIGIFGTGTNIVNIIIYFRMGILNTSSNLNLFSLSVGDLGVCLTTFLHGPGFAVIVMDIKDLPFNPFDTLYYVIGWPLSIFSMINRLLTTYVALERMLCVVLPFKIRSMFSIKRCLVYITIIYTYTFLNHLPLYIGHRLEWVKQEGSNESKLVLTHQPHRSILHGFVYYSVNFFTTMTTVIVVFICTIITSGRIKTSKAWRKSVSGSTGRDTKPSKSKSTSLSPNDENDKPYEEVENSNSKLGAGEKMSDERTDKEMRLVKMITTVSIVYLICYIPDFLLVVLGLFDPDIKFTGAYYRLAEIVYGFALIACGINSTVNMFIFYRMSTRFRQEFSRLFGGVVNEKK